MAVDLLLCIRVLRCDRRSAVPFFSQTAARRQMVSTHSWRIQEEQTSIAKVVKTA